MTLVGLVVVSHSGTLAEGVAELAREMGVGRVLIAPAGGDGEGGLGTSIDLIDQAVHEVDAGAGVVLLADLGSSVLTAKTYIEDTDRNVALADAPLVEGAVAAASMAATEADLQTVVAAAEQAYTHRKT